MVQTNRSDYSRLWVGMRFKIWGVLFVLAIAAGCVTGQPNYTYNASASDPVLIFQSDFDFHTFFEINTDPSGGAACKNFKSVGYTLKVSSVLIVGTKPNPEIQVSVPAGQPVAVKAHYNFSAGLGNTNCGPLYVSFTPEKGKTYLVRMVKDGEYCSIYISDPSRSSAPVKTVTLQDCDK